MSILAFQADDELLAPVLHVSSLADAQDTIAICSEKPADPNWAF